jgi:hypothetical protein
VSSVNWFFAQALSGSSLPSLKVQFCAQTLLFCLHLIIKFLLLLSFMLQSKGSLVPFVFRPLVCCYTSVSIYHDLLRYNQIIFSCLDNPLCVSSVSWFFTQALLGSSLPSLRFQFCAQTLLFCLHLIIKFLLLLSFTLQSKGSLVLFMFRPLVYCCMSISIYHDLLGCNQIIWIIPFMSDNLNLHSNVIAVATSRD